MLWLEIDKDTSIPLIKQIYKQIRVKILKGELKGGDQLPSTRELSSFLHISRNVILESYEMLLAEGYIISRPKIGTFVAAGAFLEEQNTHVFINEINDSNTELNNKIIDFRSGVPALDLLPRKKWTQIKNQIYLNSANYIFGYGSPAGRPELRKSICHYLQRTRGLACHQDQIIITSGSVQSFSILSKLFLKNEVPYIIEDPLHIEIKKIFNLGSSSYYTVPVDDSGIQTALLPSDVNPRFIFLTPSHQYPLGGNLPIQRRIELIQYARAKRCYIIEDDYDSEFRYAGSPVSSLQGLDPNIVIYVGTFSKVMFPSIRLGYIILPWPLVMDFREIKRRSDYFTNVLDQLTMSRFIDDMLLDRHIHRMKKFYHKRRDWLIETLLSEFGSEIKIRGESTGLHIIVEFRSFEFTEDLIQYLLNIGIGIYPVSVHSYNKDFPRNLIIMGYSHLDPSAISTGVVRLKEGLQKWKEE